MKELDRETVLQIYDTVADQSLWPEVLDRVTRRINAHGCIIFEWQHIKSKRSLRAPHFSNAHVPEILAGYLEKCAEYEAADQDVFEAHSLASDSINLIDDSVLNADRNELIKRENVRRLLMFGICHRAAGLLNKDNKSQSRFSVQLGMDRGRLTNSEHNYLVEVLPHVAKALDLGRPAAQMAREHNGLLQSMDLLRIGVCILDARGCIIAQNVEFDRQLDQYPAMGIDGTGCLKMLDGAEQKKFQGLLDDALNHGKFGARPRKEAITAGTENFLCVEVTPLENSAEIGSNRLGGFILYSTDTSQPLVCDPYPLQRAFNLTDAEIGLVLLLAEGKTNGQIAQERDRAVSTINAQVKSILAKTNCATRTQFVRLMMNFGAEFLRYSH